MSRNGAVSFRTVSASSAVTRPNDTTAYATGDVISDTTANAHHTFTPIVRGNGAFTGAIEEVKLTIGAVDTLVDMELWLFVADIATVADNAAFAPTDAEVLTCIGVVDLPASGFKTGTSTAGAAGNKFQNVVGVGLPFTLPPASQVSTVRAIYGQLVVRGAYTPTASTPYTAEIVVSMD